MDGVKGDGCHSWANKFASNVCSTGEILRTKTAFTAFYNAINASHFLPSVERCIKRVRKRVTLFKHSCLDRVKQRATNIIPYIRLYKLAFEVLFIVNKLKFLVVVLASLLFRVKDFLAQFRVGSLG
jgi:hypothetical protein